MVYRSQPSLQLIPDSCTDDELEAACTLLRERGYHVDVLIGADLVELLNELAHEERVEASRAGQERARAAGKRIGRPPTPATLLELGVEMVKDGTSQRQAAAALGIEPKTLRRALRLARGESPGSPSPAARPPDGER